MPKGGIKMRRYLMFLFVALFCIVMVNASDAAEKTAASNSEAPAAAKTSPTMRTPPPYPFTRGDIITLFGTLNKIDNSTPGIVKLEVTDNADGKMHSIEAPFQINVAKITDISEMRSGDTVRIMAKKVSDKEVAINIIFGKIKPPPRLPPSTQASQTLKSTATATVQKANTKK